MGAPEFLRAPPDLGLPNDPVLEPVDLATIPNLILLDARDDADFLAMPVNGARQVPMSDWLWASRTPGTGLDNLEFWQAQVDALGIRDDAAVAVFDDGRLNEAARVWFILQYFGLRAHVVNGGPAALRRVPLLQLPRLPAAAAVLRPGTGPVALLDRAAVLDWIARGKPLLDARTAAEHPGLELRGNPRGGHLPGARSLPHSELMDGRRLRPANDLRRILAAAGFAQDHPFATYCDRGGRSALTAIAALRAGFAPPAVYFLSFADWSTDARAPVLL